MLVNNKVLLVGCCGRAGYSLKEYSQLFDVLEIQETFYSVVREETLVRWRGEASGKLVLTVKAFQGLTHPGSSPTWRRARGLPSWFKKERAGLLSDSREAMESWAITIKSARLLDAKFIVVQLPPSFKPLPSNVERIRDFLKKARRDGDVEVGVEVRGGGWRDVTSGLKNVLRDAGVTHVVDPLSQEPVYVHKTAYFRLHGRLPTYRYQYPTSELERIADRVKQYPSSMVLFNNLSMAEDALRFRRVARGLKASLPPLGERVKALSRGRDVINVEWLSRRYGYLRVELGGEEPTIDELLVRAGVHGRSVEAPINKLVKVLGG